MPLYFPKIYEEETSRTKTDLFYGLNRGARIGDGEWADMLNMTSDELPVAAVRGKRETTQYEIITSTEEKIIYLLARPSGTEGRYYTDVLSNKGDLRLRKYETSLWREGFDKSAEHKMVRLGAYVIIFPELIYVNTTNATELSARAGVTYGNEELDEGTTMYLKATACDFNGNDPKYQQSDEPGADDDDPPKNGDLWHKTWSNESLYRYNEDEGKWEQIEEYLKIQLVYVDADGIESKKIWSFEDIGQEFRVGDYLRLSGSAFYWYDKDLDKAHYIHNLEYTEVDVEGEPNKSKVNYLVINGWVGNPDGKKIEINSDHTLTIGFEIPIMDNIVESGNRLWGCRYGLNNDGQVVNEIYCSARGDFYRWIAGPADNDDSPVTFSIGADGAWTGVINFGGTPMFFKEDTIHRVYGSGASGYSISDSAERGVMVGAHESVKYLDGSVYYYSKSGVMRYDGTVPICVSEALGNLKGVVKATAGICGRKYYLNVKRQTGADEYKNDMYVLDTDKGVWTRETGLDIIGNMETVGDNLYCCTSDGVVSILPYEPYKYEDREWTEELKPVKWYAETGIIGLENPDDKYLSKIALRVHLEPGAVMRVLVQYNSMGDWRQIGATNKSTMGTVTLTVLPVKCDHLRLRLEGEGDCKIYSITKTFERAGEK